MAEAQSDEAGRTGVCRHCGALVGAGEARCMMCGTPVARHAQEQPRPPRAPHADPETLRFLRAIISRPATFTFVFLILNVFVYALMWLSGGATGAVLEAYGAKFNVLINAGQWWRFVTPIFLHVQLPSHMVGPGLFGGLMANMHLLSNMYGLFMLGPYVEKLYGSARFVVFWIVTGIAGVVASYFSVQPQWAHGAGQFIFKPDTASAGASGALFGLMGVLFIFGIKFKHELPEGLKRTFGTGLLPTLFINLFIGYVARQYIDNAAHLGGLLAGMGLALAVGYKRPGARGPVARAWHAAQIACLVLVAVSFVMVYRNFDAPPPRLSNLTERARDGGQTSRAYVEAVNAGQSALAAFTRRGEAGALAAAAEKLEQSPAPSPDSDALREELRALVDSARATAGDESLKPEDLDRRRLELDIKLHAWQERFEQWLKAEGEEFGISMQNQEEK
ncbi:MAG TPA: rhomboid family intramembrane serine protease [Pyrinomonadaceae bacterium]